MTVWRATYQDYAPAEAFEKLDETRRLPYWAGALAADPDTGGVWVAEVNHGPILGVVSFGPSRHEALGGRLEIKHLYVARDAQGSGIGRRLLNTVLHDSPSRGVALAVVRQNEQALGFYTSMGGTPRGTFVDPGPLWRSENIVVAWDTGPLKSRSNG